MNRNERAEASFLRGRVDVAELTDALADFDVARYVTQARAHGRTQLPTHAREEASSLYERIVAVREHHATIPRPLDDVLELARRVLFPEWFLSRSRFPRYRVYINLGVLNWYLRTNKRVHYQDIWLRCIAAIGVLVDDVLAFEIDSLAGLERRGACSFDRRAVASRVALLEEIGHAFIGEHPRYGCALGHPPESWQGYVSRSGSVLALTFLTAFPLTGEHDEYMFIRTLHISECCFWGILTASLAAIESLKRGDAEVAISCLAVALAFAQLLTPLIRALKTMSGARFEQFREATGEASAIQSRTYQLMQIALTGAHPGTIGVLTQIDELRELRFYDQPGYLTLADLAARGCLDADTRRELAYHLDAIDHELRKWRKVHRGIVRNYLATRPVGTGGTNGAEYLKRTVELTIAGSHRDRHGATPGSQALPDLPREVSAVSEPRGARPVLSEDN